MPNAADIYLVVLFDHEIKLAAKALAALTATDQDAEGWPKKATDALNACVAALHGAEDDKAHLVLTHVSAWVPEAGE